MEKYYAYKKVGNRVGVRRKKGGEIKKIKEGKCEEKDVLSLVIIVVVVVDEIAACNLTNKKEWKKRTLRFIRFTLCRMSSSFFFVSWVELTMEWEKEIIIIAVKMWEGKGLTKGLARSFSLSPSFLQQ